MNPLIPTPEGMEKLRFLANKLTTEDIKKLLDEGKITKDHLLYLEMVKLSLDFKKSLDYGAVPWDNRYYSEAWIA